MKTLEASNRRSEGNHGPKLTVPDTSSRVLVRGTWQKIAQQRLVAGTTADAHDDSQGTSVDAGLIHGQSQRQGLLPSIWIAAI